jgi:hypothetical protein
MLGMHTEQFLATGPDGSGDDPFCFPDEVPIQGGIFPSALESIPETHGYESRGWFEPGLARACATGFSRLKSAVAKVLLQPAS